MRGVAGSKWGFGGELAGAETILAQVTASDLTLGGICKR